MRCPIGACGNIAGRGFGRCWRVGRWMLRGVLFVFGGGEVEGGGIGSCLVEGEVEMEMEMEDRL